MSPNNSVRWQQTPRNIVQARVEPSLLEALPSAADIGGTQGAKAPSPGQRPGSYVWRECERGRNPGRCPELGASALSGRSLSLFLVASLCIGPTYVIVKAGPFRCHLSGPP